MWEKSSTEFQLHDGMASTPSATAPSTARNRAPPTRGRAPLAPARGSRGPPAPNRRQGAGTRVSRAPEYPPIVLAAGQTPLMYAQTVNPVPLFIRAVVTTASNKYSTAGSLLTTIDRTDGADVLLVKVRNLVQDLTRIGKFVWSESAQWAICILGANRTTFSSAEELKLEDPWPQFRESLEAQTAHVGTVPKTFSIKILLFGSKPESISRAQGPTVENLRGSILQQEREADTPRVKVFSA